MYYFTSDYHIGHSNILKLCDRPFKNIEEHDQTIISNHNSIVTDSDIVYDLGDLGYRCNPSYLVNCLERMRGKRIVLLGNHDKPFRQAYKRGYLNKMIRKGKLEIIGGGEVINDKDLYVSKLLKFGNQRIFLSHLACRTWPNAFRGAIMLHGHSHGNLPEISGVKTFDVGVDVWDFRPVRLEIILEKCKMIELEESAFEDGNHDKRESISARNRSIIEQSV